MGARPESGLDKDSKQLCQNQGEQNLSRVGLRVRHKAGTLQRKANSLQQPQHLLTAALLSMVS